MAQREFTLLVKLPGQGRGFAGKGARSFTVKTTLGANLHEAVEDAYQREEGKKPERGIRFKGPKQVTSAGCITVKDFVAKCGALDGDSMECAMHDPDGSGDRQARRSKAKEKTPEAAVETPSKKRKMATAAQLPVPTPAQLLGKPVQSRCEIWDCLQKLNWKRGNVKSKTFGSGSITLGVTRGAPGADGFDQEGYNDQVVPGCLSKNDRKECAIWWKLLRDEGRALGFVFSSVQLNKIFQAHRPRHHRRTDKDHQWCLSLGEFTGGDFCWQERDQCFSVSTKDQWQKVDGRLRHWVLPHQPQKAIRYSIVLFRNKGAATEIFYHSDAAKPM